MTPKEKAKELYNKFDYECKMCAFRIDESRAIQCALIAVDEILNTIEVPSENYRYWQEVKKELEAMK